MMKQYMDNMRKKLVFLFLVFSFFLSFSQNQNFVNGRFIVGLDDFIVYEIIDNEPDEFVEKKLLIQNIENNNVDTLIMGAFFVDAEKINESEIIYSEGKTINNYNVLTKQNRQIYESKYEYSIIDILIVGNSYCFFIWDNDNNKIHLYLLEKDKEKLLCSFNSDEYENPGLKSYSDDDNLYFTINGLLYSYNFENERIKTIENKYLYTFIVLEEAVLSVSFNKGDDQKTGILGIMNKNFADNQLIMPDFKYHYTDQLFFMDNVIYVYYSSKDEKYKIDEQQYIPVQEIPLFKNKNYSIFFVKDRVFKMIHN